MLELDDVMLHGVDDMIEELDLKIFNAIQSYNLIVLATNADGRPPEAVKSICSSLKLEPLLEYFVIYNISNFLPYHNAYHAYCMVLNCYEGAQHEKVTPEELRALVVAALFHDFNHSGGKCDDKINVAIATGRMIDALDAVGNLCCVEREMAIQSVRITKYPYDTEPVSIIEKIIRDADLMQPYEQRAEVLLVQYLGLKTEMEILQQKVFSYSDFSLGNQKFLDGVVWNTKWAATKASLCGWDERKAVLKNLLSGVR